MLKEKRVLVGISGGIAAYKTPYLIRQLIKEGCSVKVVVSKNALQFVTLTTLTTLSQNPVYYDLFSQENNFSTEHISLAQWAEVFIIAPASANIIAKIACGICDDALSTSILAYNKDLFVAPAMNNVMYCAEATQHNLDTLKQRGAHIIEPTEGKLACGTDGKGRMEEPEKITQYLKDYYSSSTQSTPTLPLKDKTILITASGTQENIDPVRYIGNRSSGKMGFALANCAALLGAKVILVSGKTTLSVNHPNITLVPVVSAKEMFAQCQKYYANTDIAIMAAAVADYKPLHEQTSKIKKHSESLTLTLTPTKDILKSLGEQKKGQFLVGFALETDNEEANAIEKLQKKNLDLIVLNSLKDAGAGFETDTNKVTLIDSKGFKTFFALKSKDEVAKDIINKIIELL
jgi:phosphopantothenoylcysteine decarboxylase/phosphopantothenate--cysteine ligase, prokaryotic